MFIATEQKLYILLKILKAGPKFQKYTCSEDVRFIQSEVFDLRDQLMEIRETIGGYELLNFLFST